METTTNTEYLIEQIERDILIRQSDKCYIPMFKFKKSYGWCFSLPVQTMYLLTINEAKEIVELSKNEHQAKGWICEFKIAQIINTSK